MESFRARHGHFRPATKETYGLLRGGSSESIGAASDNALRAGRRNPRTERSSRELRLDALLTAVTFRINAPRSKIARVGRRELRHVAPKAEGSPHMPPIGTTNARRQRTYKEKKTKLKNEHIEIFVKKMVSLSSPASLRRGTENDSMSALACARRQG